MFRCGRAWPGANTTCSQRGGCRRARRARAGFEIDHSEPQARVWRSRGRPGPKAPHTQAPHQTTTLSCGQQANGNSSRAQTPRAASVGGAVGPGGHGRASRSTTPSRRLACGDLAGGRARRHPTLRHHTKQQHQAAANKRTAAGPGGTRHSGSTHRHVRVP